MLAVSRRLRPSATGLASATWSQQLRSPIRAHANFIGIVPTSR